MLNEYKKNNADKINIMQFTETANTEIKALKQSIKEYQTKSDEKLAKYSTNEKEKAKQLELLSNSNNQLTRDLEIANEKCKRYEQSTKENNRTIEEYHRNKEHLDKANKTIGTIETQLQQYINENTTMKKHIEQLTTEYEKIKKSNHNSEIEAIKFKTNNTEITEKLKQTTAQYNTSTEQAKQLQLENKEHKNKIVEYEIRNGEKETQIALMQAETESEHQLTQKHEEETKKAYEEIINKHIQQEKQLETEIMQLKESITVQKVHFMNDALKSHQNIKLQLINTINTIPVANIAEQCAIKSFNDMCQSLEYATKEKQAPIPILQFHPTIEKNNQASASSI